jgi:tripartite-type tricarboxylate transporter receptor subunit TctC
VSQLKVFLHSGVKLDVELMSTTILPGVNPFVTLCSPNSAPSTCAAPSCAAGKRHVLRPLAHRIFILAIAAPLFVGGKVNAQADYPSKPVQLIAQQPPGSLSEAISRIWAECASRRLGQPVVVVSKPGANGVIATNHLKLQPADGYTIMTAGMSQLTITPYVYKDLPYDPGKDFDGVAVLSTSPLLLVASAGSGIKQLSDIAKVARHSAGGVDYGSPGKGSPAHLLTAAVIRLLKADGTHVPFVGEAAGVAALLGGHIDIMTLTSGTAAPLINNGRVIPLAIYADARHDAFAQVPTIVELTGSKELARLGWLALVVKAGTPPSITKRLREATAQCANADQRYRARLARVTATPVDSSSADVKVWIDRDTAVFRPIITQLGLKD